MEMPFDYPGSTSDMVSASAHQMRKLTSWLMRDEDGDGVTNWSIHSVPDWWTDDDMDAIVDDRYASERCHHEHDCCGQLYARKGKWAWHPFQIECGSKAVVISQYFVRNI